MTDISKKQIENERARDELRQQAIQRREEEERKNWIKRLECNHVEKRVIPKAKNLKEFISPLKTFIPRLNINQADFFAQNLIRAIRKRAVQLRAECNCKEVPLVQFDDFLGIQDWITSVEMALKGKADIGDISITKDQVEILNYLCEEPTVRIQCEINAYLQEKKDRKTLKNLLDDMAKKGLISRPPNKKKGWIATVFGKDFHAENYT